ncbi:MAG: anti-sigma factor family protein [Gemmatimonadaceae bacterium]
MNPIPMKCDGCDELLLEFFEGGLDKATKEAVDAHVASCARCQGLVRDISGIRESASALPDIVPSHDLWDGIEARIQPVVHSIAPRRSGYSPSRSWMAAAAAGLVIVSSSITYVATTRSAVKLAKPAAAATRPPAQPPRVAGATVEADPAMVAAQERPPSIDTPRPVERATGVIRRSPPTALASTTTGPVATASELAISGEIDQLQEMLRERRDQLDPATVRVVEENLAIIDAAVAQARSAVERDPASGFLNHRLESALNKKMQLLRTVALLRSST